MVATAVGGLVDAIEDGESGLLVPPRDVAALGNALNSLLASAELRSRLGAAARTRASTLFGPAAAAASLLEVYRQNVEQDEQTR